MADRARQLETWAGPSNFLNAPLAAGDPATMFTNDKQQQHIFYRDVNGDMDHVLYVPGSGLRQELWGSGAGSSTMGTAPAGDAVTLTPGGANDQQHIFYRDTNGDMEHVFWDPSYGLHAESWGSGAVGNPATIFSHETGFACVTNCAHNQQHLFYRNTSNAIVHVRYDQDDKTLQSEIWAGPGSSLNAPAAAGDPAAMFTDSSMQQHLFYRAFDNTIQHVYWDNHSSTLNLDAQPWGWDAVGNPSTMFTHETNSACFNDCTHSQQHIFYRDNQGNVFPIVRCGPTETPQAISRPWSTPAAGSTSSTGTLPATSNTSITARQGQSACS
jgi:hypothetical protein